MTSRKKLVISDLRIRGKLAECDFFLEQMASSDDVEQFGYHLSAFLAALSTFTNLGLIRQGAKAKGVNQDLHQLRKKSREVDLLLEFRDVEVHREGVTIGGYSGYGTGAYGVGLWSRLVSIRAVRDLPQGSVQVMAQDMGAALLLGSTP
jgi:hypothetical protein